VAGYVNATMPTDSRSEIQDLADQYAKAVAAIDRAEEEADRADRAKRDAKDKASALTEKLKTLVTKDAKRKIVSVEEGERAVVIEWFENGGAKVFIERLF